MGGRNQEVPGNTIESQRLFERQLYNIGRALLQLESTLEHMESDGTTPKAIRLKFEGGAHGSILAVITAQSGDDPIVGFISSPSISTVLVTLSNQLKNGSLKWKEDQYG